VETALSNIHLDNSVDVTATVSSTSHIIIFFNRHMMWIFLCQSVGNGHFLGLCGLFGAPSGLFSFQLFQITKASD